MSHPIRGVRNFLASSYPELLSCTQADGLWKLAATEVSSTASYALIAWCQALEPPEVLCLICDFVRDYVNGLTINLIGVTRNRIWLY